eukprot:COSAG02_NODE_45026_length_361_cov_0.538168_1_plen_22_part_01
MGPPPDSMRPDVWSGGDVSEST